MLPGIDDPQMAKVQTLKGLVHRFGYFGGFAEFAFDPIPVAVMDEKKIKLSTAMGGPEKCLGRLHDLQKLFDGKALPRGPYPGIAVQSLKIGKVKQSVKEARIPQVYLGCFDLALTEVFVPRLKLPDHKGSRENVEVGAHRFIGQVERTAEVRGIPGLTMVMGEHRPETAHGCGRNRDAELGDVASQEGLNEALAPGETIRVAAGKKRTGEPAPEPDNIGTADSSFVKTKTGKLHEFDATGKGLRNILDKIGRCTPQNEKLSLVSRAVDQDAQHAEKLGHGLNFINDHETSQGAKHQLRILEAV